MPTVDLLRTTNEVYDFLNLPTMRPKNFTERKKRIITFTGLYAASIAGLFFIFSALGIHFTTLDVATTAKSEASIAGMTDNQFIETDSVLHSQLYQVEKADEAYAAALLSDTASGADRLRLAAAATREDTVFRNSIDNVERRAAYAGTAADARYYAMVNSFRSILLNHAAVRSLQSTLRPGAIPEDQCNVLQWKNQLAEKESELERLQLTMKNIEGGFMPVKGPDMAASVKSSDNEVLKKAFDDQQKDLDALRDKYERARTENASLAAQVTDLKKNSSQLMETTSSNHAAALTASENKVSSLEQKLHDMSADIAFARIDCNLDRADAEKIISNARQRRELLVQSLSQLNSLAGTGDAATQRKAKEKIARLNHIATTLHD